MCITHAVRISYIYRATFKFPRVVPFMLLLRVRKRSWSVSWAVQSNIVYGPSIIMRKIYISAGQQHRLYILDPLLKQYAGISYSFSCCIHAALDEVHFQDVFVISFRMSTAFCFHRHLQYIRLSRTKGTPVSCKLNSSLNSRFLYESRGANTTHEKTELFEGIFCHYSVLNSYYISSANIEHWAISNKELKHLNAIEKWLYICILQPII